MNLPIALPFLAAALLILLLAAVWDFRERLIPNRLVLGVLGIGVVMRVAGEGSGSWISLVAAAIVFLPLSFLAARNAVGGGDVKMITAITFLFPPEHVPLTLVMIALFGGVLSIAYLTLAQLLKPKAGGRVLALPGPSLETGILRAEAARVMAGVPMPFALAIFAGVLYSIVTEVLPCIYATSFSTSCSL